MATKYENVVIFSLNVSHLPQKLAKNQRNSYILCINVAILRFLVVHRIFYPITSTFFCKLSIHREKT